MTCPHDLAERETAVADGYCPLCMHEELARLRAFEAHCKRNNLGGYEDGVYAGTRLDWIDRALAAEAKVEALEAKVAFHKDRVMTLLQQNQESWEGWGAEKDISHRLEAKIEALKATVSALNAEARDFRQWVERAEAAEALAAEKVSLALRLLRENAQLKNEIDVLQAQRSAPGS